MELRKQEDWHAEMSDCRVFAEAVSLHQIQCGCCGVVKEALAATLAHHCRNAFDDKQSVAAPDRGLDAFYTKTCTATFRALV